MHAVYVAIFPRVTFCGGAPEGAGILDGEGMGDGPLPTCSSSHGTLLSLRLSIAGGIEGDGVYGAFPLLTPRLGIAGGVAIVEGEGVGVLAFGVCEDGEAFPLLPRGTLAIAGPGALALPLAGLMIIN